MKNQKSTTYIVLVLGALTAIGPFSIDMYLPGFPAIAEDLNTSIAEVQLSLASFFVGLSLGQLFYGPITDRFGRKPPLYVGLSIYILASVACIWAPSAEALIVLRFVQALGGSVGMVVSRAMVRDLYPPEETAKIFSLLMLVMGVAPIIAPTLGGMLVTYAGWQSIFLALAIISFAALLGMRLALPETRQPTPSISLHPKIVLKDYWAIFKNRQFIVYVIVGGMTAGGMFAYISGSPFVFIEMHQVTEAQFGWIFGANAFGLIMAGQVNRLWLRKNTTAQIIRIVNAAQLIVGALLVFYAFTLWGGLPMLITLVFVYMALIGFIFPNKTALALAPFAKNAGAASALMGSLQFVFAGILSAVISALHNESALPMTGAMALCTLVAFIILQLGARQKPEHRPKKVVEKEEEVAVS